MTLDEIVLYSIITWLIVGGLLTSLCMIIERRLHQEKYLIKDMMDFSIGVVLWPLMLFAIMGLIKPPKPPKKKPKIIVSEDNETEEAFANRCKRL